LLLALIPLTCWLCALLAIPRKPLPGDEVQELVYRRLVALAVVATLVACCSALLAVSALAATP